MQFEQFRGTGVAMVTPFDASNKVDVNALSNLTEFLIKGGVNYLVVLGTTGESVTLTESEKQLVLNTIVQTNAGRLPIVLGMGGNDTARLVETIDKQNLEHVDALLSVSPYYNKPTQEGLYAHYSAISAASPKPIILYNVPGRTASNLLPKTVFRLANDFENIIGIKEAAGDITQAMQLIQGCPKEFLVISGDDAITFPFVTVGGDGVISVVGNAYPEEFSTMVRHALNGEVEQAKKIHYGLLKIIDQLFVEGNPAGIKAAMKLLGLHEDVIRLPLVKMTTPAFSRLKLLMEEFKNHQ
jgi:4-hydroxy-tetrahydrodipicolinate synthase